jgi:hypothetical protein
MADTILDIKRPSRPRFWDAKEMNSRRSLVLFGIGALVGLGIAAYGLFTAAGTTTRMLPPEDVAMVNGRHILRVDFITQIQIETALPFDQTTKAQRVKVLSEMIDEELLVQRGLEVDLAASDPDVRMALANGVNIQVDADVASQLPTEEQLKTYYEAHKTLYSSEGVMQIRDLSISQAASPSPQDGYAMAQRAVAELRMAAAVDAVKMKYGLQDTIKIDKDENFDFAAKIKLGAKVFDEAAKLTTGEVSEPFLDAGSLHIIVMVKRTAPVPRNFEDARDTVLQDYKKEGTDRIEQANLKYLRQKSDMLIAPELRQ